MRPGGDGCGGGACISRFPMKIRLTKYKSIKTTKLMSKLWSSSIGKKLVMSLSGLFLLVFLLVHLVANLFFYGGEDAYNAMCEFMDTNPVIRVMVPVLALGFIIHIVWATVITLKNQTARPVKYKVQDLSKSSTWESRNMYILGIIILGILAWHLTDFWAHMQLQHFIGGEAVASPYELLVQTFANPVIAVLYIVWIIALWFHLRHGFWSAFQTIGLDNQIWIKRWQCAAKVYAFIVAVGFISIPVAVLILSICGRCQ